jgi:hypothetical protein
VSAEVQISKIALLGLLMSLPDLKELGDARAEVATQNQDAFPVQLLPLHEVLYVWERRAARARRLGLYVADIDLLLKRISELQPTHVGLLSVVAEPFLSAIFLAPDLSAVLSIVRGRDRRVGGAAERTDLEEDF